MLTFVMYMCRHTQHTHTHSQELLASHSLQSVLSISRDSDPCLLVMTLKGDVNGCKMQIDTPTVAREITNVLDQCKGEGMVSSY